MRNDPPDCMELMKRIHNVLEKNADSNLMTHGITFAQLHMLMVLNHAGEAIKLKDVEKHFGVAQSTAAGIAVRLEKKGLITSFTDAGDKRIKRLQITEVGREVCLDTHASMEGTRRQFLSSLTPEEEQELTRLLRKIYNSIR